MNRGWARWDLEEFPRVAPPFSHVLGPARLVVAAFDLDTAREDVIDQHWGVDTAAVVLGRSRLRLRVGDLLVWIGPSEPEGTDLVWPVSRVVEAGVLRAGRQRVSALAFHDHEAVVPDELPAELVEVVALAVTASVASERVRRELLALWDVDVMCPVCGGFGRRQALGMPVLSLDDGPSVPTGPEDHGDDWISMGCVGPVDRWACGRCGSSWTGSRVLRPLALGEDVPLVDTPPWQAHPDDTTGEG